LADTEDTRWLDADFREFRKALTRLDSVALIARFDRSLILRYTYLAMVARYTEIAERAENPHLPPRTLPLDLAMLIESVVVKIADGVWQPWIWRFRKKHYIWALDKMITRGRDQRPEWSWNATIFRPALMTKEPGMRAGLTRSIGKRVRWLRGG
jgi:hypothetical protein